MSNNPTPSDFGALVDRVDNVEKAVQKVAEAVAENTAITKDIKDAQTFARITKKILVTVAAVVVSLGGMLTSWQHLAEWVRNFGKH